MTSTAPAQDSSESTSVPAAKATVAAPAPVKRAPGALESASGQGAAVYRLDTRVGEEQMTSRVDPYEALASWEGEVLAVGNEVFSARIRSRTGSTPVLDVELPRREVDDVDQPLLDEGAVFYWEVGYRRAGGRKVRESRLVFQRLPVWRELDLMMGKREAENLQRDLGWL